MIASFTKDGKTASIRLPASGRKFANALAYIGADCTEEYLLSCNGESADGISVSLQEENSAENLIGMAASNGISFWKLNRALMQMDDLPYEKRIEIEKTLMNNGLKNFDELEQRIRDAVPETVTTKYYFPLTIQVHGKDSWGCMKEEGCEEDGSFAVRYENEIRNALYAYNASDEENMAAYFHGSNSVKAKLISADWDFERKNGELYGCITIKTIGSLSEQEENALKNWICGQNSDGLGEGFEQQEIEYNRGYYGGIMFVSFWNSSDDYFIDNEAEFNTRLNEQLVMGGM